MFDWQLLQIEYTAGKMIKWLSRFKIFRENLFIVMEQNTVKFVKKTGGENGIR